MVPIRTLLVAAGILQIVLSIGSIAIPRLLNWKTELNKLPVLLKQMFWVYAGYILVINFCFGLLSILAPGSLLDRSLLATVVCGFIAVYWGVRVLIQFIYFDRKSAPKGFIYFWGEVGLVILFIFFTVVYGYVAYLNFSNS